MHTKIQLGIIEEKGENQACNQIGQDFQGSKPDLATSSLTYADLCQAGNIAGWETIAFISQSLKKSAFILCFHYLREME